MADEMMVLLRFGGDADDLLPRYLGAVRRWREDDATSNNFSPPLMAAHMKTEDGLLVMNLWANDEDHKNFGLKVGPSLEAEGLTRPWVEHFPIAHLGWEGTTGASGLSKQAMSEENVEIVRRLYEFWRHRDLSVIEDAIHPDAVFDVSRNVFNPGVHHGIDGFRRFTAQTDEIWEDFDLIPEELNDAGDKVVVAARISGTGRSSGVEIEMLLFQVVAFRDGKVARFTASFRDRNEALEAAGLSEQAMSQENVEIVQQVYEAPPAAIGMLFFAMHTRPAAR